MPIGEEAYAETFRYDYDCYLMTIYDWGQLRVHFWLPFNDDSYRSVFSNNSTVNGKQEATDDELKQAEFKLSSNYRTTFRTVFDDALAGITSYSVGFHTLIGNDTTAYNGWNFNTPELWDGVENGFWYAPTTHILWHTVDYKINEDQIETMEIEGVPVNNTHVGKGGVKNRFIGIPIRFKNKVETKIIWKKNFFNLDDDGKVQTRVTAAPRNEILVIVDFDFTQREYIITYLSFWDVFTDIGGLSASFGLIVYWVTFFIPLGFLITLADITKENTTTKAKNEYKEMIQVAKEQFLAINQLKGVTIDGETLRLMNDLQSVNLGSEEHPLNEDQLVELGSKVTAVMKALAALKNDEVDMLLMPVKSQEKSYQYMKGVAEMSVMKTLGKIRGRINFHAIYHTFDQLECEKIKNKHLLEAQAMIMTKTVK